MRLWSLHPKYLDRAGLLACWREGLLAKKVLEGNTKGYKNHPQLLRFKESKDPNLAINSFLTQIYLEAERRGYEFQVEKIVFNDSICIINVTEGQLNFEINHLLKKLETRDYNRYSKLKNIPKIEINPIFTPILGNIEIWEKL